MTRPLTEVFSTRPTVEVDAGSVRAGGRSWRVLVVLAGFALLWSLAWPAGTLAGREPLTLTRREWQLLEWFLRPPGRLASRAH